MANFLPPAIFEIKAIADQAVAKFGEVNKELEKMEGKAEAAGGKVSGMEKASRVATAGLMALGAAFAGFAAVGIKEAIEAQNALNKLGTTMSALGINTEKNRKQFQDLADSYVDLGFAGDDATLGFENLLRVTGDVSESQKLLALSADLARTKNIGLTDAAGILAKASQGNAKAFKDMGITLDTTLPKTKAVEKAFDELNNKIGKQAEQATKTFAVQLKIVKERFNDTAESLGAVLLPMLETFLEKVNESIEFVKRNSAVFKVLGGIILTVAVALASYNAAIKVQMALTKAWSVITGVQATVTKLLTGQQIALNTAMKLNPIGLIVSAVTLLIGGMVLLWNKSETFRKGVIAVGKAGLMAFASIVPILGQVGEAILKVVLTPLKTMLSVLSKLPGVGKFAKAGLDILNKGLEGVSDFADKASAKAKQLAANLDKLNKPIKIGGGAGLEIPDFGDASGGKGSKGGAGLSAETIKNNEAYQKTIKSTQKAVASATKKYHETSAKNEKEYQEKVTKLNKDATEKIGKLQADAAKKKANLEENTRIKIASLNMAAEKSRAKALTAFQEKTADINKRYAEREKELIEQKNERIADIESDYAKRKIAIAKQYTDKVADINKKFTDTQKELTTRRNDALEELEESNAEKIADIKKQGAAKLQAIIQQSIDELRQAFQKGTEFKVGDIFKGLVESGKASADELAKVMRERLEAIKKLAQNASALASKGFSQGFIQEVVSSGPELGNQLAESILTASDSSITELQALYKDLETTSNTGLDALAISMNQGANLATAELTKAYKQAQADTAQALAEQNTNYLEQQAKITADFAKNLAKAKTEQAEALAEAATAQAEALAEALADFNEAIADANKAYEKGLADAKKTRDEALAEANADYQEALAEINTQLAESIAEANADLAKALEEVNTELGDAIAETNKELADGLAEAEKEFADSQAEAKKTLAEALAEIQKEFEEKMGKATDATNVTKKAVKELLAAFNSAKALMETPIVIPAPVQAPTGGGGGGGGGGFGTASWRRGEEASMNNINVNVTGVNLTSPQATTDAVLSGIKYGSVVAVSSPPPLASRGMRVDI